MSDGEKEEGDMHAKRAVERKREEEIFFVLLAFGKWITRQRTGGFYPSRRFFCLLSKNPFARYDHAYSKGASRKPPETSGTKFERNTYSRSK